MYFNFKSVFIGFIIALVWIFIVPSDLLMNFGFLLGGVVAGYLVADDYLNGAINGVISSILAALIFAIIFLINFLVTNFLYVFLEVIGVVVISVILGGIGGAVGIFIRKQLEKEDIEQFDSN